jgi:hypothetical protein
MGSNSATLLASNTIFVGKIGPGCSNSPLDVTKVYFNVVTIERFHCNINDMNFTCYFGTSSQFNASDITTLSTDWNNPGGIVRTFNVEFTIPTTVYHDASNFQTFSTIATSIYAPLPQIITQSNLDISEYGRHYPFSNTSTPGKFIMGLNLCYPNSQLQPNYNSTIRISNQLTPTNFTTINFSLSLYTTGYSLPAGIYYYTITPYYNNGVIGAPYSGTPLVVN